MEVSLLEGDKEVAFEGHLFLSGKMLEYHLHNEVC